MSRIVNWVQGFALAIGGPGLFLVAFLDSSFLSLPEINDLLVVMLVVQHKERMLYYAMMATLGSVVGCVVLYWFGRRGGEVLVRKRFGGKTIERAMELSKRYGIFSVAIPAILPPPAPFKIFVLLAGVAAVPVWQFATVIAVARGFRYVVVGSLAVRYGDEAIAFIEANGRLVAFVVAGLLALGVLFYLLWRWRRGEPGTAEL
ncbi:MAG: VTT domain-containing protein [Acidobacteriota bacterium]|nr:VTT domain-containing protein [Acidobacteriota bacterium]